ncbi:DUF4097 family beta strand repeat-containing protein [Fredinandcohnia sp. 179-A 10B2 NHS]|uniref:LiaG family protein n=1 Tax=Fredinandcohnia sp. 179-A 10B2 NHS TaxID=3235176 RepID=UPI0039A2E882
MTIFLILIGIYLVFTNIDRIPWVPFGKSEDSVKVTDRIDKIEIDITSIKTEVIPDKRNDVKAVLQGKGEVIVSKSGDTILVEYERGLFHWSPFNRRSNLTIYVPEDFDQDMNLRVGSGHIELTESPMKLDELSVEVHSGNVKLQQLTVQEFELDIASGNATIKGLSANEGDIDVRSGNATIEDYTGKLLADVSSGRLKAEITKLTDSISADVNSGLLDLDLPDDADFTLTGKKSSGFISNDFTLKNIEKSGNTISGIHGDGTHPIELKVSSGKIDIR